MLPEGHHVHLSLVLGGVLGGGVPHARHSISGQPLVAARVQPDHVHVLKGDARDVLPYFVDRKEVDLLVMGSIGRTGIAGLLIGETAETLIRSVQCSVLVVKPPGFECPVAPPATERG